MEKGDNITMFFHCFGITSEEECKIIDFDEKTLSINSYTNDDEPRVFIRKTGRCLNDNTTFGAARTIKPI